jgi:hypothetical protein
MKDGFVKSSPRFFRLIERSALLLTALLLLLAAVIPAPLQEAANPARTPNPVKSAWFLLWVQELVSWSRLMIWPVVLLGLLFFFLPWLPGHAHVHRARWFPKGQSAISAMTLLVFAAIVALTIIALFFRGANWSLSFHI